MQIKIIPTVEPESVIGVRTPELKSIAKDIVNHDSSSRIVIYTETLAVARPESL